jgi:drug/metabolite transporter (DMT)-like permease
MTEWMRTFGLLLVAISLSVTGETLLKLGMNRIGALDLRPETVLPTFWRVFTTPVIVIGFALIFGGSLFWLVVLSKWNLSLAYPLLSLSYIASLVIGAMFLNETVTPLRVAGVLVIVAGVVLVTKS